MIKINQLIEEDKKLQTKMLLQIHDELIFEVPNNELSQMESIVHELMSSSINLEVPLSVEIKRGGNWGNLR